MKSLSSVDSRPEDSSLLQTSPLLIENKRQPPDKMHNQVTETDTPILMDIRSFGNVDTFMPPPSPLRNISFFFSRYCVHLSTSSKIPTQLVQSDIRIKKNKETILQLGENMRISYLRPDLSPVREATLQTLSLRSYILKFHIFEDKKMYLSLLPRDYGLSLVWTLHLPLRVSAITEVNCTAKKNSSFFQNG